MAALVSLEEIKSFLIVVDNDKDDLLRNLANYASAAIESYCGREFASSDVINEVHDGGCTAVFADRIPINNVNVVAEYDGYQYVPLQGPDSETGLLPNTAANVAAVPEFIWDADTGKVSKDTKEGSGDPPLDIQNPKAFNNYARGVKLSYNGGYDNIPNDLKMATLDFIKMLWKKEQGSQSFSLQGESKRNFSLAPNNFPPHIRRILDFYRIII